MLRLSFVTLGSLSGFLNAFKEAARRDKTILLPAKGLAGSKPPLAQIKNALLRYDAGGIARAP